MASRARSPWVGPRPTGLLLSVVMLAGVAGCVGEEDSTASTTERAAETSPTPTNSTPPTDTSSTPPAPTSDGLWGVVEVIDGDTIDVVRDGETMRVRMIGINAPERDECFYDEATSGLRALVPANGVRLVTDTTDLDRFGRLLRFVETADGVDLGGLLVESGLARSNHYPPDTSRNARYDELQQAAIDEQAGLWAAGACGGGAPTGEVQIGIELQYDAPGDDNDNLSEEWVRFTNEGPAAVDLSGWQVADESSSHRYRIDDLVLEPGAAFVLFTGCGTDSSGERYWCNTDSAVWNNSGDTVFLNDQAGNLVTSYTYRGE